ncbi:MAG TPA: peptidase S41, partial [Vicinamibacteria bacterium]|nr:peptidase S41 [Vicinamibacteria bacterium]
MIRQRLVLIVSVWAGLGLCAHARAGSPPLLLRQPALSRTQLVFNYAGDLWIVGREGGTARRLTAAVGDETNPCFSPDGTLVAFNGEYDGNQDVYVVPAAGGTPRRLTFHPAAD